MTDLKRCPFCGGTPNSGCNYGVGGAYVNCVNRECLCNPEIFIPAVHNPDASLSLDDALVRAKAAWNNRPLGESVDNALIFARKSLDRIIFNAYGIKNAAGREMDNGCNLHAMQTAYINAGIIITDAKKGKMS